MNIKKSIVWDFAGTSGSAMLNFAIGVILARLLGPKEFGILGIVMIFIGMANTFAEGGILLALVRKSNVSEEDRASAFALNAILGVLFLLLLFVFAPFIESFFKSDTVVDPLRYASLVVVFTSLSVVPNSILMSSSRFDVLAKINLLNALLSGAVAIVLALLNFGIWALLHYQVCKSFLSFIFAIVVTRWWPRAKLTTDSLKELASFSFFLVLGSFVSAIQQKLSYLIIGRIFSISLLGNYNRAENINSFSTSLVAATFRKVFVPFYAKDFAQKGFDVKTLKKVNKGTFLISSFLILFIVATSNNLILVLLGDKWETAGDLLFFLGLASVFTSINGLNIDILVTAGLSKLLFKNQVIKTAIFLPGFIVALFFGVYYFLAYNVLVSIVAIYVNGRKSKEVAGYSIIEQIIDVGYIMLVTLFCTIVTYSIGYFLGLLPIIILGIQSFSYLVLYVLLNNYLKLDSYVSIKLELLKYVKK